MEMKSSLQVEFKILHGWRGITYHQQPNAWIGGSGGVYIVDGGGVETGVTVGVTVGSERGVEVGSRRDNPSAGHSKSHTW